MGSHTFTWPHYAQEVYVTGTFDNWQKTVKLDKHANDWHKTVDLPAEKVLYKFVVDGNWTTDHTSAQEQDDQGIYNNVLTAEQIKSAPSSQAFLSSVSPSSTTAAMAGSVKSETHEAPSSPTSPERNSREVRDEVPGAFPITPANELQQFLSPLPGTSNNPVPGGEGSSNPIKLAAGEPVPASSEYTSNTVDSHVKHGEHPRTLDEAHNTEGTEIVKTLSNEEQEQIFNANPIPATSSNPVPGGEGSSNPIKLAAGEPVPESSEYTSNTLDSHVKHDRRPSELDIAHNTEGTEVVHPLSEEEQEKAFGVAPLPATSGIGNPIHLAAGEPVPHPSTFTNNTIHSNVSDMKSSTGAPQLPPMFTPGTEAEANGGSMFDLPSVTGGPGPFIPESSLPMGGAFGAGSVDQGPTISSVAPHSTTAQLAGAVPIRERGVPEVVTESERAAHESGEAAEFPESVHNKSIVESELLSKVPTAEGTSAVGTGNPEDVPAIVTESQHRAHVDPEAASSPTAVADKLAMEEQLKRRVPEEWPTSESGVFGASERGISGALTAGALAAGGAVAAVAYAAKDKAQPALDQAAEYAAPYTGQTTESTKNDSLPIAHDAPTAPPVPAAVTDSQHAAHVDPEASANPEAVGDKADFERELKATVPEEPATSESGLLGKSEGGLAATIAAGTAAATAALGGAAYAAQDKAAELTGQNKEVDHDQVTDAHVPSEVIESQHAAHFDPEASANPEAVSEKAEFERELKARVPEEPATSESGLLGKSEGGITGQIAAGTAAAGAAVTGAAYAAQDKAAELTGQNKDVSDYENTDASHVPSEVIESQHAAHVDPEASANPEAVREKADFENELKARVPEEPATSESGLLGKSEGGLTGQIAAGTAALGATAAGAAYLARDKAAEATGHEKSTFLPPSVQSAIDSMNHNKGTTAPDTSSYDRPTSSSSVPEQVIESQKAAHFAPEASAEPSVVAEKSEVEEELLRRVETNNSVGEPAPTSSAALYETAPSPTGSSAVPSSGLNAGADSQAQSYATKVGTLAADPTPVDTERSVASSSGLNAPADSQAQSYATQVGTLAADPAPVDTVSSVNTSAIDRPATATSSYSNANADLAPLKKEKSPFDPKTESELLSPSDRPQSRDVSPMSKTPREEGEASPAPITPGASPSRSKSKRSSSFFNKDNKAATETPTSPPGGAENAKPKKKGFLAKLKEKLKG